MEPLEIKRSSSQFGECVVMVSASHEGKDNCMPASWAVAASFDPMMISVHIGTGKYTDELIRKSGVFGASVLADDQGDISTYAGTRSGRDEDKFTKVPNFRAKELDVILVDECVAALACKVVKTVEAGDHTIFIGEVKEAYYDPEKSPLMVFRGDYRKLGENMGQYK